MSRQCQVFKDALDSILVLQHADAQLTFAYFIKQHEDATISNINDAIMWYTYANQYISVLDKLIYLIFFATHSMQGANKP